MTEPTPADIRRREIAARVSGMRREWGHEPTAEQLERWWAEATAQVEDEWPELRTLNIAACSRRDREL